MTNMLKETEDLVDKIEEHDRNCSSGSSKPFFEKNLMSSLFLLPRVS